MLYLVSFVSENKIEIYGYNISGGCMYYHNNYNKYIGMIPVGIGIGLLYWVLLPLFFPVGVFIFALFLINYGLKLMGKPPLTFMASNLFARNYWRF